MKRFNCEERGGERLGISQMGACQCEASKTRLVPFGFTYGTELEISRGSRDRVRVGGSTMEEEATHRAYTQGTQRCKESSRV